MDGIYRIIIRGGLAFAVVAFPALVLNPVEAFEEIWLRYLIFGLLGFSIPAAIAAVQLESLEAKGERINYREPVFWACASAAASVVMYWLFPPVALLGVWLSGALAVGGQADRLKGYE